MSEAPSSHKLEVSRTFYYSLAIGIVVLTGPFLIPGNFSLDEFRDIPMKCTHWICRINHPAQKLGVDHKGDYFFKSWIFTSSAFNLFYFWDKGNRLTLLNSLAISNHQSPNKLPDGHVPPLQHLFLQQ